MLTEGLREGILQAPYPRRKIVRGIGEFDEEVKMIGHQNVAAHEDVPWQSCLAELQKRVVDLLRRKQRLAGCGAAGQEINRIGEIDVLQAVQALDHIASNVAAVYDRRIIILRKISTLEMRRS